MVTSRHQCRRFSPGDRRDGHPLLVQLQYHDQLRQPDHPSPPPTHRRRGGLSPDAAPTGPTQAAVGVPPAYRDVGFSVARSGENSPGDDTAAAVATHWRPRKPTSASSRLPRSACSTPVESAAMAYCKGFAARHYPGASAAGVGEAAGEEILYAGDANLTDEQIAALPFDLYRQGYHYYRKTNAHPGSTFKYTMSSKTTAQALFRCPGKPQSAVIPHPLIGRRAYFLPWDVCARASPRAASAQPRNTPNYA